MKKVTILCPVCSKHFEVKTKKGKLPSHEVGVHKTFSLNSSDAFVDFYRTCAGSKARFKIELR